MFGKYHTHMNKKDKKDDEEDANGILAKKPVPPKHPNPGTAAVAPSEIQGEEELEIIERVV